MHQDARERLGFKGTKQSVSYWTGVQGGSMPQTCRLVIRCGALTQAGPAARFRPGSARTDWDPGPRAGFVSGKVVGEAENLVHYDDTASPPQWIISILCSLSEHKIYFALALGISRCQYLERVRYRTQGCLAWLKYLILSTLVSPCYSLIS